jgi:lipoprotein LpqH
VTIDGNPVPVSGRPFCAEAGGRLSIGGGNGTNSFAAVLNTADGLDVETVGIVVGGQTVSMAKGAIGDAEATKDGSTYTISGNGFSVSDISNPGSGMSTKPFNLVVTCP